jgi:Tfp pilus assembly protein PilE
VGQQQLLLIILGVIVIGIAVAIGITMFADSAASSNRDAVVGDLENLAGNAEQFFRRPTAMGGGGNSFNLLTTSSITLLTNIPFNTNGSYFIETAGAGSGTNSLVVIKGVGVELFNGSLVAAHVYVYPDHDSVATIN